MLRYSLKRFLQSMVTVLIVITVVFLLLRLMPLEGYFGEGYDKLDRLQREAILRNLGLLDPVHVQLMNFFGQLLQGDLGTSQIYRKNVPIVEIIQPRIPYSMFFGTASLALSLVAGVTLGMLMARRKDGTMDRLGTAYIVLAQSVPALVYVLIIQIYGTKLINISMLYNKTRPITWVLPIITASISGIAGYAMWMRRYMVDELTKDYVKLARAKGLSSTAIMLKHILRNAFVPMASYLPAAILSTISGQLIIEGCYSIPGMGGLLIDVIQRQDNTVVQSLILVFSTIGIFGLFLGDVLMALLDPRIKLERGSAGGGR